MAILEIDPSLAVFIGAALALVGLARAFWGRSIVARVMAMMGAAIGSILGFLLGVAIAGYVGGLILALVGGFIGSLLFGKLVKIGLALVMGLLAAGLVFVAFGTPTGTGLGDTRAVAAIFVLFIVFAVAYYFIEEILGIVTAIIGGILLALGAYIPLRPNSGATAGAAGLVGVPAGGWHRPRRIRIRRRRPRLPRRRLRCETGGRHAAQTRRMSGDTMTERLRDDTCDCHG